jgi:hypothetical protein
MDTFTGSLQWLGFVILPSLALSVAFLAWGLGCSLAAWATVAKHPAIIILPIFTPFTFGRAGEKGQVCFRGKMSAANVVINLVTGIAYMAVSGEWTGLGDAQDQAGETIVGRFFDLPSANFLMAGCFFLVLGQSGVAPVLRELRKPGKIKCVLALNLCNPWPLKIQRAVLKADDDREYVLDDDYNVVLFD